MLPLDGIVVLDLTRLLPGALATQCLANFGAQVIKVEEPWSGDTARYLFGETSAAIFSKTNLGKQSVAINLKDARGREAFLRLAAKADVLIEGFRPGVMERLQLGEATLRDLFPRLIYVRLTGFGSEGSYRAMAGHDINYLALSGVLGLIGMQSGHPIVPGVQIADVVGGTFPAIIGVLLALQARTRIGKGQTVDISILDGIAALLALPLASYGATGKIPDSRQDALSGGLACYNVYPTSDRRWVSIGAIEPKFWLNLCRELGCEEFVPDQFAPEARQLEIRKALEKIFLMHSAEEWFERTRHKDCCLTPVRKLDETVQDSSYRVHDSGLLPHLFETPGCFGQRAPDLGEHTDDLMSACGFDAKTLEEMRLDRVIC